MPRTREKRRNPVPSARGALAACAIVGSASAQMLAFPTAEGSGRFAKGGRGGDVYEVTNLASSGPGSIVDAVSQPNRTIVFRVSGTIDLGDQILQPKSYTTIAGQTAPGDGICIKGRIQIWNHRDIVIRHIRVRVNEGGVNADGDAIDIAGLSKVDDKVTNRLCKNIIIDHASVSFSRDENISSRNATDSVTVQWSILSEALRLEGSHSYGSLIRGERGQQKTFHHNLYAHNLGRNPRPGNYVPVTEDPEGLHLDFRNNVIYNWENKKPGYNEDKPEENTMSRYNFVGNAYIRGPNSTTTKYTDIFKESCAICYGYFEGNSYEGVVPADQWSLIDFQEYLTADMIAAYKARSKPHPMQPVRTTSAEQARKDVLARAGATVPKRDIIDLRIVSDVENKTGRIIDYTTDSPEGAWPELKSLPAPDDDDHDGMPDDWERKHGLNPKDPADRNKTTHDGYTMLEQYLNSLTGEATIHATGIQDNPALRKDALRFTRVSRSAIEYQLDQEADLDIAIYDLSGNLVAPLPQGFRMAGLYRINLGRYELPSGAFYVQSRIGSRRLQHRLVSF